MKAFKKYIIDFTEVNYYLEMHAVIWHAFEFPDYYGCNWSAF
jgi:RNAse (barnase) inhibitor barstar